MTMFSAPSLADLLLSPLQVVGPFALATMALAYETLVSLSVDLTT